MASTQGVSENATPEKPLQFVNCFYSPATAISEFPKVFAFPAVFQISGIHEKFQQSRGPSRDSRKLKWVRAAHGAQ